jgi:hypothetical protein
MLRCEFGRSRGNDSKHEWQRVLSANHASRCRLMLPYSTGLGDASSHVTEKVQDKIVEKYVELSVGPLIEVFTAKASTLLCCTFSVT